jgi:benzylsuccinate CoA-transferase BbsF subunit
METTGTGKNIFEGIRVLDFCWMGVGPLTSKYLGEYGAEVIKIESSIRTDPTRSIPPFKDNTPGMERSATYSRLNNNKYSITINLKHPGGIELAKQLIAKSDIVVDGWTPGTMARFGLSYEEIKKVKPDIIMLSTCMQGQTGPASAHPGSGFTLTSLTGFNYITGWPDRAPAGIYGPYTDVIAPIYNAACIMGALDYRRRTGKGQYLDLSQCECSVQFLSPLVLDYVVNGREFDRKGNHCDYAAPHGVYKCQGEDRWCAITAFTDEEWGNFCTVIGNPEWTKDPKFASISGRVKNAAELDELIETWTISRPPEEVMSLMQNAGVAAGVVKTGEDLWEDPQFNYYKILDTLEHPEIGTCVGMRTGINMPMASSELKRAPLFGEHTEYICTQVLGMSDEEFVGLLADGVLE